LALSALHAALRSSEDQHALEGYAVTNIFKLLQEDPNTDRNRLIQAEWAFLPLLEQHDLAATALEEALRDDPDFFCQVIRTVYRPEGQPPPSDEPTETERQIATNGYRLLHGWSVPPGAQRDGTFSEAVLTDWLKRVTTACEASGHLKVALQTVGQVLRHAPADPDGLWIHHGAARALNARQAEEMRVGFRLGVFNARGVYYDTKGREERELASRYRDRADQVEARGYHRFASTLRELADSYERDAERAASDALDEEL
jgi:tetratricopeptide (TPR) repeat protein